MDNLPSHVQVETEWYQEQHDFCVDRQEPEPDDAHQELIGQLRDEIRFLKQQVVYWMAQEPVNG